MDELFAPSHSFVFPLNLHSIFLSIGFVVRNTYTHETKSTMLSMAGAAAASSLLLPTCGMGPVQPAALFKGLKPQPMPHPINPMSSAAPRGSADLWASHKLSGDALTPFPLASTVQEQGELWS